MATPMIQTIGTKLDTTVLSELQALGLSTSITACTSTLNVYTITWATTPSASDANAVVAYFQQNNHLGSL